MNPFQQFLAARAAKAGTPPVVNQSQPVSRAEFNDLSKVVLALVEDVQAATDPAKLANVINTAFEAAAKGVTPTTNGRTTAGNRAHLAPKDDPIDTAPARTAAPVANGRNRAHLAPKGE